MLVPASNLLIAAASTCAIQSFSVSQPNAKIVIPKGRTTTAGKDLDVRPSQVDMPEKRRKCSSHSPTSVDIGKCIKRLRLGKCVRNGVLGRLEKSRRFSS